MDKGDNTQIQLTNRKKKRRNRTVVNNDITSSHETEVEDFPETDFEPVSTINNTQSNQTKHYLKNYTPRLSNGLRSYAVQATGYSWQTGADAAYFNSLNSRFNFWIAVLSAIATIGIGGGLIFVQTRDKVWAEVLFYIFQITSVLLLTTIGILQGMQLAMNLANKIVNFSISSAKFGEVARNIKDQFNLPNDKRDDAIILQKYTTNRFNELEREKPFIRDSTAAAWNEYMKHAKYDPSKFDAILELPDELTTVAYIGHNATPLLQRGGVRSRNLDDDNDTVRINIGDQLNDKPETFFSKLFGEKKKKDQNNTTINGYIKDIIG